MRKYDGLAIAIILAAAAIAIWTKPSPGSHTKVQPPSAVSAAEVRRC
jgi:hypothetical protein